MMSNKPSSINSILFRIFPSISINSYSLISQFVMTITVFILLVAFVPCISSSPTPKSTAPENNNNNNMIYNPNDYQADSSLLSSSVHVQPTAHFYDQPRTHANQFLISHANDNQIIVPKWFTRFNNDDDDDIDDYIPGDFLINKRSLFYDAGGYQNLKKRKQLNKPPMEVMNEIVNSIYLKR